MTDYKQIYKYWIENLPDKKLRAESESLNDDEIALAFSGELMFGTGGIRGIMGLGTSRLNVFTLKKIAKGTAEYFKSKNECPDNKDGNDRQKIIIAYDNRKNSKLFARLCATVFASEGILSVVTNTCMPTPYLSFMVRRLRAAGGVMITASHNPQQYNGYKLYGSDGCQLLDDDSRQVSEFIKKADMFAAPAKSFSYYQKQGLIRTTDAYKAYLAAVSDSADKIALSVRVKQKTSRPKNEGLYKEYDFEFGLSAAGLLKNSIADELRIIYTPLCGTGGFLAPKLLKNEGMVFVVPSQAKPDENFTCCPVSNPEKPEAFEAAMIYAEKFAADLVIASDPDADRMGAMVKSDGGGYEFLTGNQIGVLLADYILSENSKKKNIKGNGYTLNDDYSCGGYLNLNKESGYIKNPIIVRTIVSTPMADEIAKSYGAEIIKVPTGFKYIGDTIKKLEQKGEDGRFLLGFEESHGYLSGGYARDKDGLQAAVILSRYASYLKSKGQSLVGVLENLYKKYGYYLNKTLSFRFDGLGGAEKIFGFMKKVRGGGFLTGEKVFSITDYNIPKKGSYTADMVEYTAGEGDTKATLIIRPSGTEPFIKAYITVKADSRLQAETVFAKYKKICDEFFV